jgi:hypothetical protein
MHTLDSLMESDQFVKYFYNGHKIESFLIKTLPSLAYLNRYRTFTMRFFAVILTFLVSVGALTHANEDGNIRKVGTNDEFTSKCKSRQIASLTRSLNLFLTFDLNILIALH